MLHYCHSSEGHVFETLTVHVKAIKQVFQFVKTMCILFLQRSTYIIMDSETVCMVKVLPVKLRFDEKYMKQLVKLSSLIQLPAFVAFNYVSGMFNHYIWVSSLDCSLSIKQVGEFHDQVYRSISLSCTHCTHKYVCMQQLSCCFAFIRHKYFWYYFEVLVCLTIMIPTFF